MACPPCSGDCDRGRNCPARQAEEALLGQGPDEDDLGGLGGLEKATVVSAAVFALCALGAIVTLVLKGCTA